VRSGVAASAAAGVTTGAELVRSLAGPLHYTASCGTCPWTAEGLDADRLANLHTNSTRSGFHWRADCERIHGEAWSDGTEGEW
jgi:hypothetical protein